MTTTIPDPFPFKLYRVEGEYLIPTDVSKKADRLIKNLQILEKDKPKNTYVVVKVTLEVIAKTNLKPDPSQVEKVK
jgi:hypothetical protein